MDNKTLVRTCFDAVWNAGPSIDSPYVASNISVHIPPFPDATGPEQLAGLASMWRAAMPDLEADTDVLFGEGDRVIQHFVLKGTHSGSEFMGFPARGRSIVVSGVSSYRVSGGQVVEWRGLVDVAGLMQQLQ